MRMGSWLGVAVFALNRLAVGQTATVAGNEELPALNHFDASVLNHEVDPCVDFYKFVCSKWQAANPIPAGLGYRFEPAAME